MARILIIDDDDLLRPLIGRCLADAGHTVIEAVNGRDGLRKFQAEPTDLVITDLVMPDQEGTETIMRLRKEYPATPILAISGGSAHSKLYLGVAQKVGAHRTLAKPFSPESVVQQVGELLAEQR